MKDGTPRTISIQSDSYAMWGTRTVGPPEPIDKSSEQRARERAADRIPLGKVLARFGWSPDQLSTAETFGFPKAMARSSITLEPIFSASAVDAWRDRVKAFAKAL